MQSSKWIIKKTCILALLILAFGIGMKVYKNSSTVRQMTHISIPGLSLAQNDNISLDLSSPDSAKSSVSGVLKQIERLFYMGVF